LILLAKFTSDLASLFKHLSLALSEGEEKMQRIAKKGMSV